MPEYDLFPGYETDTSEVGIAEVGSMEVGEALEYFGASVADVRALVRHVDLAPAAGSSNPRYAQARTNAVTDAEIRLYLGMVASRVAARIRRYEQIPERTREHIYTMARDLTANGAAYYALAAMFPASADPNNANPYVADLRQRFHTGLDELITEAKAADDAAGQVSAGHVSYSFPAPSLTDRVMW